MIRYSCEMGVQARFTRTNRQQNSLTVCIYTCRYMQVSRRRRKNLRSAIR